MRTRSGNPKFPQGVSRLLSFYAAASASARTSIERLRFDFDRFRGARQIRAAVTRSRVPALRWALAIIAALSIGQRAFAQTAADPNKGRSVYERQCALCHSIGPGEPNRFGPNLFGITQRKAGMASGYRYSPEFLTMAIWTWSPDGIASFLAAPGITIPGNRMSVFQGVADKDMDDLIAFLAAQK